MEFLKSIGRDMPSYQNSFLEAQQVRSNIESFIGTFGIPAGLVGPILFESESNKYEEVFTNVVTTEGALVASMNRGAAIVSMCGGFKAHVQKQTMLRAPLFAFENLYQARDFSIWLKSKREELNEHIKKFSKRAKLVDIKTDIYGKNVSARFYYETGDAAGQNMTTICTWQSCLWIEKKFNAESDFPLIEFTLEGNGASDKKVSYSSMTHGRGTNVVVETVLDEEIIRTKLKTTSDEMLKAFSRTYPITSLDGMVGNCVNIANAIAGIFAATGQDIACVHESAVGALHLEKHERGLYMSLNLPRLVVGSVGGGTGLPHQKESLELMGCYGSGKVERLAKLIAGFTLALEISTLTAITSNQFAIAHERLGRNRPVDFLKASELNNDFFKNNILLKKHEKKQITFSARMDESNGIITQFTADKSDKYLGLSLWNSKSESGSETKMILKSKAMDKETLNCMYILVGMIDPKLAKSFGVYSENSEFVNCHKKENLIYELLASKNAQYMPEVYGVLNNDEREISIVLMEFLEQKNMQIINSETTPNIWSDDDLDKTVDAIVDIQNKLKNIDKSDARLSFQRFNQYNDFVKESIKMFEDEGKPGFVELLKDSWTLLANNEYLEVELPLAVVHNDFNPRNIAITKDGIPKVYDWELAMIDFPQRDIAELLCFIGDSESITKPTGEIIDYHRTQYNKINGTEFSKEIWELGFKVSLAKFISTRYLMYVLGNKITEYNFIDILNRNVARLKKEGWLA